MAETKNSFQLFSSTRLSRDNCVTFFLYNYEWNLIEFNKFFFEYSKRTICILCVDHYATNTYTLDLMSYISISWNWYLVPWIYINNYLLSGSNLHLQHMLSIWGQFCMKLLPLKLWIFVLALYLNLCSLVIVSKSLCPLKVLVRKNGSIQ